MMDDIAISVKNVYKSFKLPHERHTGLKQAVINFRPGKKYETQKVLEDVSFEIKKGEFFGIVGRNGSGKSTLLKLLAQIYTPDKGGIVVNGSLTTFIELGVGFNPELTGKENVFLNGALLGFDRKQMAEMYDDIVNFAELKRFMDQKLKNYSSGMQVRLAFSIAIRAKSDILLIDEVLAVGDSAFQTKCFQHFRKLKREGTTVVFVSHDMGSVQDFCDRALLLDSGNVKATGTPVDIASLYTLNTNSPTAANIKDASKNESEGVELLGVRMKGQKEIYKDDETVAFELNYNLSKRLPHHIGISIMKNGISIHERSTVDIQLSSTPGMHKLQWSASVSNLTKGLHQINVSIFHADGFRLLAYVVDANRFMVEKTQPSVGGFIDLKSDWREAPGNHESN
jgi:ABC-2 type transport system ATP-binding protein